MHIVPVKCTGGSGYCCWLY